MTSVEAMPPGPLIDPADPAFVADPYPAYARVREATPVWHPDGGHLWYLTRFADVHAAFRDRRLGTTFLHRYTPDELGLAPDIPVWRDPRWTEFQSFERWELLNLEPPLHTRLRRLVTEAFTPRTVEGLRAGTEARARSLLEPGRAAGSIDLVGDYAQHFSLGIICALIGVPPTDETMILAWSDATVRMYEPEPSDEQQGRSNDAAGSFRRYLLDVVADRRHAPTDDLLSALRRRDRRRRAADRRSDRVDRYGPVDGRSRSRRECHGQRHRAPGGASRSVGAHPRRRGHSTRGHRGDPPVRPAAAVVRALGPRRRVSRSTASRSRSARAWRWCSAAANRDPRRHPDPDRFDVARPDTTHLSLGGGIHFCIGAPLARLELETTLTELARTEAELVVQPPAVRRPTFQFRGYDRLVVALSEES